MTHLITLPVKDSCFFKDISKIDVGVQKVWIKSHGLLKVMNSQPDLSLCIEDAAKIGPCHSEVWSRLNSFQITSLEWREKQRLDMN